MQHLNRRKRQNRLRVNLLQFFLLLSIAILALPIGNCQSIDYDENRDNEKSRNHNPRKKQKDRNKNSRNQKNEKRKDSKIVRKILTASSNGEHYQVLGLKNYEIKLPFQIRFPYRFHRHPPSIKKDNTNNDPIYIPIFHPNVKNIKRAYRQRARLVHPDKNSDPDADQAFDALDKAAAILMDERLRRDYDLAVKEIRERKRQDRILFLKYMFGLVYGVSSKISGIAKRVLGPFLTPLVVLGALIV